MKGVKGATWSMLSFVGLAGGMVWGGQAAQAEPRRAALRLPWREAGLGERQAAAHLLNRFAFGARPGEIDHVVAVGLEAWVERQIAADLPDPNLDARLRALPPPAPPAAPLVRLHRNPPQA